MSGTAASRAQGRLLALLYGGGHRRMEIGPNAHIDPTVRACCDRSWVGPSTERGTYPNGEPYMGLEITPAGIEALINCLRNDPRRTPR